MHPILEIIAWFATLAVTAFILVAPFFLIWKAWDKGFFRKSRSAIVVTLIWLVIGVPATIGGAIAFWAAVGP